MNDVSDTVGHCRTQTFSFMSPANSHHTGSYEERSAADREPPPRGALYEVHRFISLEKAKLLALLIVLGCACNHALLRYKYGNILGEFCFPFSTAQLTVGAIITGYPLIESLLPV